MLESQLYSWIKDTLKGREVKIQRIESGTTGCGIPDCFYRSLRMDGWIEMKCLARIGEQIKIPFRPGQFSWLMNYIKLHGNAFLFVAYIGLQDQDCLAVFKGEQILQEYALPQFVRENTLHAALDNIDRRSLYSMLDMPYEKRNNKRGA